MRLAAPALALSLLLLCAAASQAGEVLSQPIGLSASSDVGAGPHLAWRGSLALSSREEGFGGFSGMQASADCGELTAISDDGYWMQGRLAYGSGGQLSGFGPASIFPLLAKPGSRGPAKQFRDAEALSLKPDGTAAVAFETTPRIESFDLARQGFDALPAIVPFPAAIAAGPGNGEMEAMQWAAEGPLAGNYLVISESNFDSAGNPRAWAWAPGGENHPASFTLKRLGEYSITDLAFLPGGEDVIVLQRSFIPGFTGMAIARFPASAIREGAVITPAVLFQGRQPAFSIDNMEALAVCQRDGETRLTVMSDDNYLTGIQRTLVIQFALVK